MSFWEFFRKNRDDHPEHDLSLQISEKIETQMEHINHQINEQFDVRFSMINELSHQINDIHAQVMKLTRLQYKATQNMQGQLEQITSQIECLQQTQNEANTDELNALIERNIRWLDDMDQLNAQLQDGDAWKPILQAWTDQLLASLKENGIVEIDVLGKQFNPQLAESIGTRSALHTSTDEASYIPYQTLEVIRRGFIHRDGRMLRKAQVLTLSPEQSIAKKEEGSY